MSKVDKIKELHTSLPIVQAVRAPRGDKRNENLKRGIDLYLLGLLSDLGCEISLNLIEKADTINEILTLCYGMVCKYVLTANDRKALECVSTLYGSRYAIPYHIVINSVLTVKPTEYISILNECKVSEEYLALYHLDDIINTDDNGDIVSIEREVIIYK